MHGIEALDASLDLSYALEGQIDLDVVGVGHLPRANVERHVCCCPQRPLAIKFQPLVNSMRHSGAVVLLILHYLVLVGSTFAQHTNDVKAARLGIENSWTVRENLLGDWACVTNTFPPDDKIYSRVARLRVFKPYCQPGDVGATNGPLSIAGSMLENSGGRLRILVETYYLHVTLPDELFVGPLDGGHNFKFRRYKSGDKEKLRLARVKNQNEFLEFVLETRQCPLPNNVGIIFRGYASDKAEIEQMDALYKESKEKALKKAAFGWCP